MITTVVFDFFGVVSSEVAPFWFEKRFPSDAVRLKHEYMSPADDGRINDVELFENLSRLSGEPAEEIRQEFYRLAVINHDTVALIERLRKNYRVALLSNAQAEWLEGIFERDGLCRLFDERIISSKERVSKPSREIFELLLERVGISPEEAVFLDDNVKNVEAARTVGMHGIVFESAEQAECELSSLGIKI